MKPYILTHTAKTTLLSVVFKKGALSETSQYEFPAVLTDNDINKVYDELTDDQRQSLNTNKNTFKQFIRAIQIKYTSRFEVPESKRAALLKDESVLIASRLSKALGISSNASAKATIGNGVIGATKFKKQVAANKNAITLEDENIVYWENNGFVVAFKNKPIYTTTGGNDMYIYVILLLS